MADASTSTNAPPASHRALNRLCVATNRAVSFVNVRADSKANLTRRAVSRKQQHRPAAAPRTLARAERFAFHPIPRRPAVAFASVPGAGSATRRLDYVVTSTNVLNLLLINQLAASGPFVKICPAVTTVLVQKALKATRSSVVTSAIPSSVVVNHLTAS